MSGVCASGRDKRVPAPCRHSGHGTGHGTELTLTQDTGQGADTAARVIKKHQTHFGVRDLKQKKALCSCFALKKKPKSADLRHLCLRHIYIILSLGVHLKGHRVKVEHGCGGAQPGWESPMS